MFKHAALQQIHWSKARLKHHKTKLMTYRDGLQAPAKHQQTIAHVLGIPHHKVVCHVKRIGGGFGGKESRSVFPNAAAAVPAYILRRPVRLVLDRDEDMHMTGHRHAFLGKYKVLQLTISLHSSRHPFHSCAPQHSRTFHLVSSHHHPSHSCTSEHSSTLCPAVFVAPVWDFIITTMSVRHAASFRFGLPSGCIQQGWQGASLGL